MMPHILPNVVYTGLANRYLIWNVPPQRPPEIPWQPP
ncbi:hypothetical protein HPL003_08790 [Paenibacillus terrae HPL-003]|uniref:Uncharacterized protein n=1 Tax=Paenibacillus terrae (strain HPL-003) TaxID=985665 RepID=G7VYJ3_PAETH|nr:hypothetical protein HPL003_08790 [Paenibacillus terrae HPL-003]